jgi:hypothetical protein
MLAGISEATVPRAFVSINGTDLNPCSALQPCRSFNQALTVVEAGGEIVVQNSGGYSTGFTITQSVTIDAAGFNASVISESATDLCTITAGPSDRIVLRGISFHGANTGIRAINVTQVGSFYVEHCSISEFTGQGVNMPNGGNLFITATDVRKCSNGISVGTSGATPARLVAHDCRITECAGVAVFLATFGTGPVNGWMSNCTVSLGGNFGFSATVASNTSGAVALTLTHCQALGNAATGISASTTGPASATIWIDNCVVTKNTTGISAFSGGGGTASVIGTSPGTNFIANNGSGNSTTDTAVTLQ